MSEIFGFKREYNRKPINVSINDLEVSRQTLFSWVLDESGTMNEHRTIVPVCIEDHKSAIKGSKQEDEVLIAITKVSTDVVHSGYRQVDDVPTSYNPGGLTALYKGIYESAYNMINEDETGYYDQLYKTGITVRGVHISFSDGKDNQSPEYFQRAKDILTYLRSKEIITIFVEFGDEARGVAKSLGYEDDCIIKTDATESHLRKVFALLSKSCQQASKSGVVSKTQFAIDPNEFAV